MVAAMPMTNEERIRAHYATISVVRNLISHGETIIALAKEQIALLENHAQVNIKIEIDPRVEQLKAMAQMLGVKGNPQQWGIDRAGDPGSALE
jgi:hypothetical protein